MKPERRTVASLLPALGLFGLSLAWSGAMVMQPRPGEAVAALFGERAFERTVAAGAGAVQGFGAWGGIVVARSDDPGFVDNLYRAGAWLVVRAAGMDCAG